MYYELYIDAFFLINFMMDYILLSLVRRMVSCHATRGSVLGGAALGALCTCIIIVIPGINVFVKFILFHGALNILMIKTGLRIGWNKTFLRAFILLYISGFLVGGIMEYLHQYIRVGSLFFALAIAGYFVSLGAFNMLTYLAEKRVRSCRVRLFKNGREYETEALVDTGNRLRDPVTGKPVSIISSEAAKALAIGGWGKELTDTERFWYIPYHSIGKEDGVMPAGALDQIWILKNPLLKIESPIVAVCEANMTADDYEMIMSPDLL